MQRAYNHKTGTTDGLKMLGNFLSDINSYVREKVKTSDKDINSSVTSKKGGDENQKTKHNAKQHGDNTDMTGVVEGAPGTLPSFKDATNFLEMGKVGLDLFELGQKAGDGVNTIVNEKAKEKETKKPEYIFLVKDDKDSRNNVQIRRDVHEERQKKKE